MWVVWKLSQCSLNPWPVHPPNAHPLFTFPHWNCVVERFFLLSANLRITPCSLFISLLVYPYLASVKTWDIRATPYTLKFQSCLFWLVWVSQLRNYLVTGSLEDIGRAIKPPLPLGFLFSWEAASLLGTLNDSQVGEIQRFPWRLTFLYFIIYH